MQFSAAIRGHYIYKGKWTPKLNEVSTIENRQEAFDYRIHALGVDKADGTLVGHLPMELSIVMDYFLQQHDDNYVEADLAGKGRREGGLVTPS